ncbi:hypothetical protein HYU94_01035 [Candidatus Daviesbacteria bacterium]|nr:hypothetical protein [Candidatus Daviesbacteria bacterium]
MKKVVITIGVLLLIILALSQRGQSKPLSLETKENNEGPVAIKVTPKDLSNFEIVLDTHSEELTADLVANSELVTDQGKSYKPVSWEGTPPGGHHRSGVLKFNSISPKPKSLELRIKDIGGVLERSFKWTF